jgi:hypothetical protein
MAAIELSDQDRRIIAQCLRAAAEGPFFEEWEFHTLMGVSRDQIRRLEATLSSEAPYDENGLEAAINVLNNLLGYPHGQASVWSAFISATPTEVSKLLSRMLLRRGR